LAHIRRAAAGRDRQRQTVHGNPLPGSLIGPQGCRHRPNSLSIFAGYAKPRDAILAEIAGEAFPPNSPDHLQLRDWAELHQTQFSVRLFAQIRAVQDSGRCQSRFHWVEVTN
jgi:hypothetical protein